MNCHHCAGLISLHQARVTAREPYKAQPWAYWHADCYLRAEEIAALALGILPEHMQDAMVEAKTRAALTQGAQA